MNVSITERLAGGDIVPDPKPIQIPKIQFDGELAIAIGHSLGGQWKTEPSPGHFCGTLQQNHQDI